MLTIDIDDNPNCPASGQFIYQQLGPPRAIRALRVGDSGRETLCEVVGVEPPGVFIKASAQKVADSGAGVAFAVTGGRWGIRLKPASAQAEAWDLASARQWGEPFKIYSEEDILYET